MKAFFFCRVSKQVRFNDWQVLDFRRLLLILFLTCGECVNGILLGILSGA